MRTSLLAAIVLVALLRTPPTGASAAKQPHILYILVDDFGWADADWHRPAAQSPAANTDPLATPTMNTLLREGIELDQHFAFKFCSPSRSAIQSGRNPIHVNVQVRREERTKERE
jgi:arylsulfatase I/J